MAAKIERRKDEDFDSLMRRFRKSVNDAQVLMECKKREFYMSKSQKRREKEKQARIRNRSKARKFTPRYNNNRRPNQPTRQPQSAPRGE